MIHVRLCDGPLWGEIHELPRYQRQLTVAGYPYRPRYIHVGTALRPEVDAAGVYQFIYQEARHARRS